MYFTNTLLLASTAFTSLAAAGNLCLTTAFANLGHDTSGFGRWDVFPEGSGACSDDADKILEARDLCGFLDYHGTICGKDYSLKRFDEGWGFWDGESYTDCGIVLEVDGVEYGGVVMDQDGPDPCFGSCTDVIFGIHHVGSVMFLDVPLC